MMARSCPSIEVTAAEGSRLCCRVPRGTGKQGWAECAAEALAGVNVGDQGSPWRLGARTVHMVNVPGVLSARD